MTCCLDNDRQEEIIDEILKYENEQLDDVYDNIRYWVLDAVFVKYAVKNQISYSNFPDYDCYYGYDYDSEYYDLDGAYDHIEDRYSLYDSDDDYEYVYNTDYVCLLDYD